MRAYRTLCLIETHQRAMKLSKILSLFILATVSFMTACGEKDQRKEINDRTADSTITTEVESKNRKDAEREAEVDSLPAEVVIDVEKLSPIPTPEAFTKLSEAVGNLDKDPTKEKVVVYDTPKETEMGTERQIHIYKADKDGWKLWHKSIGAVLPSQHGGMMGDPFEDISIERGAIVINHFGGSRQKWNYTHRFRRQNGEWQLIGATVNFGALCDYWEDFDYNLSTGKVIYKKTEEEDKWNCDGESREGERVTSNQIFTKKLKTLPSMDGFYPGGTEVVLPEGKGSMFY